MFNLLLMNPDLIIDWTETIRAAIQLIAINMIALRHNSLPAHTLHIFRFPVLVLPNNMGSNMDTLPLKPRSLTCPTLQMTANTTIINAYTLQPDVVQSMINWFFDESHHPRNTYAWVNVTNYVSLKFLQSYYATGSRLLTFPISN